MIAASMAAPAIARWVRPGIVMAAGLAVAALGLEVLGRVGDAGGPAAVVASITITQVGVGPMLALGYSLIVGSAPPERAGSASAMGETSGELGIALGVATLGSVGTAVYRGQLAAHLPAEVPAAAAQAAREGIAADRTNSLPKFVSSTTVQAPLAWNATLLKGMWWRRSPSSSGSLARTSWSRAAASLPRR